MATIRSLMQKDQNLTRLCIVFLAVFIICTVLKGTLFLSVNNFQSMGKQFPEFGLLAIAMAFTLYTAGIDLSVVAIANLSAVLVAKALPLLVTPETDAGTVTAIILFPARTPLRYALWRAQRAAHRRRRHHADPRHTRHTGTLYGMCRRAHGRQHTRRTPP